MRRASNILLRVGMIVSTVAAACIIIAAIILIVLGTLPSIHDALIEGFNNGEINTSVATAEEFANYMQGFLLGTGIATAVIGAACIADAIVASITLRNPSKAGYTACIVLGIFSTEVTLVGGIFGLIAEGREGNRPTKIEE